MTEHVRVIPNEGTNDILTGDCGVVLTVVKPCPDAPHGNLRCACGAEIVARGARDER
jgi:hypothetical protein